MMEESFAEFLRQSWRLTTPPTMAAINQFASLAYSVGWDKVRRSVERAANKQKETFFFVKKDVENLFRVYCGEIIHLEEWTAHFGSCDQCNQGSRARLKDTAERIKRGEDPRG